MPTFTCDLSKTPSRLTHVWAHTVGSDHAPITLRADWQRHLRSCRLNLGFERVRFHGVLSDDMGTLIRHEEKLIYSFFNIDQTFDFLLSIGVRPFVELSFMPEALASGSHTVFRYRGNVTPPSDFGEWSLLVRKLVQHWINRYGSREVSRWYFEVWNEPNLHHFWTGTQQEYWALYRHTAEAIKSADASLRVGGPATAQNAWLADFVAFCESGDVPLDFVTTHYYPTDAFGEPGADTETQLANAPRDVMRDRAREARQQVGDRPLYYTEWNTSSNPRDSLHDQPFAAASALRTIMSVASLVQGYSFWTCSDIFAENYFPSAPFHGGFGLLSLHGIPKPVYRAFELLHDLGTEQYAIDGTHETLDVWAVADAGNLTLVITNHAQPRQPIATELVTIALAHVSVPQAATISRIDDRHANPRRAWIEMGEPDYLTRAEVDHLKAVSRLVREPMTWRYDAGTLAMDIDVPAHGVAAVRLDGVVAPRHSL